MYYERDRHVYHTHSDTATHTQVCLATTEELAKQIAKLLNENEVKVNVAGSKSAPAVQTNPEK